MYKTTSRPIHNRESPAILPPHIPRAVPTVLRQDAAAAFPTTSLRKQRFAAVPRQEQACIKQRRRARRKRSMGVDDILDGARAELKEEEQRWNERFEREKGRRKRAEAALEERPRRPSSRRPMKRDNASSARSRGSAARATARRRPRTRDDWKEK